MVVLSPQASAYKTRFVNLIKEQRETAELIKSLAQEMEGNGFSKEEVAGTKLAAKREFWTARKRRAWEAQEATAAALDGGESAEVVSFSRTA